MSLPPPATITFRDRMRQLWSPPWLRTGNAEKFLYAIGVQLDTVADALVAGVLCRFPGLYSAESLGRLGHERRIARGPSEASATYALRLKRWLDDHRTRGGPYAMLAQIHAYFAPNSFPVDLLYRNSLQYSMDANGVVTRIPGTTFAPDANPAQWARWWLFYYTDDYTTPSAEDIASLKVVPHEWNAGHCLGTLVVFPSGAELWNFPLGHVWNEPGTWNIADTSYTIPIY